MLARLSSHAHGGATALARLALNGPPVGRPDFAAAMVIVATLAERILQAIRNAPLDDDVLAERLGAEHRQAVDQAA
jgi:hypothetical protein